MKFMLLVKNKDLSYQRIVSFLNHEKVLPFCSWLLLITLLILLLNVGTLAGKWIGRLMYGPVTPSYHTLSRPMMGFSCEPLFKEPKNPPTSPQPHPTQKK